MTHYFEPWLNYQHPLVRQLTFVIASPNLLRELPAELTLKHHFELHNDQFWQQHYLAYQTRLRQLDQQPQQLLDFLSPLKSTRLGLRFEYLFWFWLQDAEYQQHYQLLAHSHQVIEGKQTRGELDFILLNVATGQVEHWEVALKFYLAEHDQQLAHWYGLNRSDTLARKLNHFSQQQFQFENIQHWQIQRRFAVLKGQLYLPEQHVQTCYEPQNLKATHTLPHWLNASRRLGTWGTQPKTDHYRLQRNEWICTALNPSSAAATWWYSGLYHQSKSQQDYMFRLEHTRPLCKLAVNKTADTYKS